MGKNELINKIRIANNTINQDYEPYNEALEKYGKAATRGYFLRAILLFYASTISIIPIFAPLMFILEPLIKKGSTSVAVGLLVLLVEVFSIFLGIIVGRYLTRHTKFFMTRKLAMSKINVARDEVSIRLNADSEKLSVIPSEYWFPEASNYILRMVETNRAENVAQALSLYDEYSYRQKTQNQINDIAKRQEEIARWPYY